MEKDLDIEKAEIKETCRELLNLVKRTDKTLLEQLTTVENVLPSFVRQGYPAPIIKTLFDEVVREELDVE